MTQRTIRPVASAAAPRIILDSDLMGDYDDIGALATLFAFEAEGKCEVLGVASSNSNPDSAPVAEIVARAFGRGDVPIARPVDGAPSAENWEKIKFSKVLVERFAHPRFASTSDALDAVQFYTDLLAAQPNGSVVICLIGWASNLAALIETGAGRDLVARKVSKLVWMAGREQGGKECNVSMDVSAAKRVVRDFPRPIVFSMFEIGSRIFTGRRLVRELGEDDPVRLAYSTVFDQSESAARRGRESWDQSAVWYAVNGEDEHFQTVRGDFEITDDAGTNTWSDRLDGRFARLEFVVSPETAAERIESLMIRRSVPRQSRNHCLLAVGAAMAFASLDAIAMQTDVVTVTNGAVPQVSKPYLPEPRPSGETHRWNQYHEDMNELHKNGGGDFDIVLLGDSITDNWSWMAGNSMRSLGGKHGGVINLGMGGDRTEHLLWRLENGCLDGYTTKFFSLLIGTNNAFQKTPCDKPEEIALGIKRILDLIAAKQPQAKVLLMPILPYENVLDPRGAVRRANNEHVNDIIIKYVDNKRVFWLDLRGKLLNADGSFKEEMWSASGTPGSDGLGHYLHPSSQAYRDVFNPSVAEAMAKYDAVPAGTAQETDPSLGYASASINGLESTVAITLSGVYLGTDAAANAATSYTIAYRLDEGLWTTALEKQTLTRNAFVIPDVAIGRHTCEIKVTTDKNKTVKTTAVFTMCDAWAAEPLTADGASVRSAGTLVYAYARGNYTVNGVSFAQLTSTENNDIHWGLSLGYTAGSTVPAEVADSGYSSLLANCWWVPGQTGGSKIPLTLRNLTPGAVYLVQIFAYRSAYNGGRIWIGGTQREATFIQAGGEGWAFGGTLVATFTADATGVKAIDILIEGQSALNAVQVRKLDSRKK